MIIRSPITIFNFQMQQKSAKRFAGGKTLNIVFPSLFYFCWACSPSSICMHKFCVTLLATMISFLFIQMKANKALNLFYFHQQWKWKLKWKSCLNINTYREMAVLFLRFRFFGFTEKTEIIIDFQKGKCFPFFTGLLRKVGKGHLSSDLLAFLSSLFYCFLYGRFSRLSANECTTERALLRPTLA